MKAFSSRMLILDENISEIEAWRLREWHMAVRQIGRDVAKISTSDENILPVLHRLKRPTFFSRDRDFGILSSVTRITVWSFWTFPNMRVRSLLRFDAFCATRPSLPM